MTGSTHPTGFSLVGGQGRRGDSGGLCPTAGLGDVVLGERLAEQEWGAAHVCLEGGEGTNVMEGPGPACHCRVPWTGCAGSRGDSGRPVLLRERRPEGREAELLRDGGARDHAIVTACRRHRLKADAHPSGRRTKVQRTPTPSPVIPFWPHRPVCSFEWRSQPGRRTRPEPGTQR